VTHAPPNMKPIHLLPIFTLALCSNVVAQESKPAAAAPEMALHSPSEIQWKDGPPSLPAGAKIAVLEGDPSKDGMFVMRVRLPDGYHVPAHTHPKPERVTVLSGTFKLAMGDNPKKADARTLTAGTYGYWPPGMVHAVWIEGETIVQFHGTGPWAINYVNPADDPRTAKKP
jgi:quercetin dioxygenase-like cupin family protein